MFVLTENDEFKTQEVVWIDQNMTEEDAEEFFADQLFFVVAQVLNLKFNKGKHVKGSWSKVVKWYKDSGLYSTFSALTERVTPRFNHELRENLD